MTPNTPVQESSVRYDVSLLTAEDFYLFNEGSHYRIYEKMGAHLAKSKGVERHRLQRLGSECPPGVGDRDFNGWNPQAHPLQARGSSGIWEGFIPGVDKGTLYKFHIDSTQLGYQIEKSDPVALLRRSRRGRHRWFGISITPGTTQRFLKSAPPSTHCTRPCRSTKFTSARGCAFPKSRTAR